MTTEVRTITFAEASGMAPFDAAAFEAKHPEIAKERREQEAASAAAVARYHEERAMREAAKEAEEQARHKELADIIYNIDTTPNTTDTICQDKIWHGGNGALTRLQYRREHSESNIEDMVDLIERGIPFATPIRLARYTDELGPRLALVDGHHRVAAFSRLGVWDIPAHHFSIVDVDSMAEASILAAGANVKHGKGNTHADYYGIINDLMDHAYKGKYRKNAFEPDIAKIAEAIGAPKAAVSRGYNNYFGTEKDKHPSLSVQCKERRDAAIIHHYKEGKNNSEIAKLFQISCPKTVAEVIDRAIESGAINRRPEAKPAVLPMCSTEVSISIEK